MSLFDEVGRFASAYRQPLMGELITYVSCLCGVILSARSKHRQAEVILELGQAAVAVFEPSIWRPMAIVNARERLRGSNRGHRATLG